MQDLPKLNRCRELLAMQEELKQARKAFDVDEKELVDWSCFSSTGGTNAS